MHKQTDISQQIKKYLNGELDARAMHELERRAQDDPFLMDALEGYENTPVGMDGVLDELHNRLQQRTTKKEARIIPWRRISIAASILLLLGLGLFWYTEREPVNETQEKVAQQSPRMKVVPVPEASRVKKDSISTAANKVNAKLPAADKMVAVNQPKHKMVSMTVMADKQVAAPPVTDELLANSNEAYKAPANSLSGYLNLNDTTKTPLDEMIVMGYAAQKKTATQFKSLKEVNADTSRYQDYLAKKVTRIRLNGKDFTPDTATSGLLVQTLKGADTAKLRENQYGYNAAQTSPVVIGNMYVGRLPKAQVGDNSTVMVPSYAMTGNNRNVLSRKSGNGGTVSPLNPVKLHGNRVKGLVKSGGKPLAYATVKIKGTGISTLTDANGNFTLYTVPDSAILQVMADGYHPRDIKVGKHNLQVIAVDASDLADTDTAPDDGKRPQDEFLPYPASGWNRFDDYLQQNARSPDGKKGVVRLSFTVNTDNSLSNFKVLKSVSIATDNLAIKLIKDGPAWYSPADDKAQTVTISIKFSVKSK